MVKHERKFKLNWQVLLPVVVIVAIVLIVAALLRGHDIAVLSPKGLVASEQRRLMVRILLILLEIAIPALTLFYYTAWKFRESNKKAEHDPNPKHDRSVVFSIWAFPTITMLLVAAILIPASRQLAPQKPLNDTKPLNIQVIATRWKWIFIYPEQDIATVNFIQIPVGTPVQFDLSADEVPMSSFWIPHLGGQLYAMTGHVNRLNLMANEAGDFEGSTAEINGAGFAGMKFVTRASSMTDFNAWVQDAQQSPKVMDDSTYEKLVNPSENEPAAIYSKADLSIYDAIVNKYAGSHGNHTEHE